MSQSSMLSEMGVSIRYAVESVRMFPVKLASRLSGVAWDDAAGMQAWIRQDMTAEKRGAIPEGFRYGRAAFCFSLIRLSLVKPRHFWGAVGSLAVLPILLLRQWVL